MLSMSSRTHRLRFSSGTALARFRRARKSTLILGGLLLLLLVHLFNSYPLRLYRNYYYHTPHAHRMNLAEIYIRPHSNLLANLIGGGPLMPAIWMNSLVPEIVRMDNPPLASYSCPPLHAPGRDPVHMNLEERLSSIQNPLLLLATFSMAREFQQRSILRERRRDGLRAEDGKLVETVFVLGALKAGMNENERKELERRLEAEQSIFGDLMRLEMEENMNNGKTYAFLQHVVNRAETSGPTPQFVIKVDQDTILNLPNLLDSLMPLECNEGIYWGTSVGACNSRCYPRYFQGLSYGLSYPLLAHLVHSNLSLASTTGTEDARTGSWMTSVDERTRLEGDRKGKKMQWAEQGVKLAGAGDWFQPEPTEWIGMHGYKDMGRWLERWAEEQSHWRRRGKRYIWWGGNEVARRP